MLEHDHKLSLSTFGSILHHMSHAIFWKATSKSAQLITSMYHMHLRSTSIFLLDAFSFFYTNYLFNQHIVIFHFVNSIINKKKKNALKTAHKVWSRASSNSVKSFLRMVKIVLKINPQNKSPIQTNPLITGSLFDTTVQSNKPRLMNHLKIFLLTRGMLEIEAFEYPCQLKPFYDSILP